MSKISFEIRCKTHCSGCGSVHTVILDSPPYELEDDKNLIHKIARAKHLLNDIKCDICFKATAKISHHLENPIKRTDKQIVNYIKATTI